MTGSAAPRPPGPTLQALWNLRAMGLFLLGPVTGVALGAETFGMPVAMMWAAVGMFLFSLSVLWVLVRGERRRLLRSPGA